MLCLSILYHVKDFRNLCWDLRADEFELISSARSDARKDIQPGKSVWSISIQRLNLESYPLSKGIIRDKKRMHTKPPQITQFSCIFNEYEIQKFWLGVEILKNCKQYDKKQSTNYQKQVLKCCFYTRFTHF